MKLRIAAMLIVSVFMSANTSYGGDLLDRMLGRAGCSSCAAPAVKSCGCGGGGLLDKLKSACTGKCDGAGLLSVDSNAGCGCEAAPAMEASCGCEAAPAVEAAPCGCDAAPVVEASCGCEAAPAMEAAPCGCDAAPAVEASPCGCDAAPSTKSGGLLARLRKMTSSCGCNSAPAAEASCGCDAAPAVEASPCGCEAAPVAEASPCGCEAAPAMEAVPCGCDAAPAIEATSYGYEIAAPSCGCDAAPEEGGCGSGGGFLSRLKGMGCGSAPAAEASSCGCDAAPAVQAPSYEVAAPAGESNGLLDQLRSKMRSCGFKSAAAPEPAASCGCEAAAPTSCGCDGGCEAAAPSCGCDGGCGSAGTYTSGAARPKLTLLDRLRGNRIPRDRDGRVIGVSNDGCNPPCPVAPTPCGCSDYVEAPYVVDAAPCSSCSTCGGGEVIYSDAMPYAEGTPVNGCANGLCGSTPSYEGAAIALPAAAAASEGSGSRVDPVAPVATEGTLQSVEAIEETEPSNITQPSVSDEENDPIVDPGAFIPRPTSTVGS